MKILALAAAGILGTGAATPPAERLLSTTVMIGIERPTQIDTVVPLYHLPGQRLTWFRKWVHERYIGVGYDPHFEGGAGVVIGRGRVLTAKHVAAALHNPKPGTRMVVRFYDGRTMPARLESISPHYDAAVLRISDWTRPGLPIARADTIRLGESAMTAGIPMGQAFTLGGGLVAGTSAATDEMAAKKGRSVWVIASPTYEGNSGGPVITQDGRLIGVIATGLLGPVAIPGGGEVVPADHAMADIAEAQLTGKSTLRCPQLRTTL